MTALYSWIARRAGAGITIEHSCGKITGVIEIAPNENGQLIAWRGGGETYMLATPPSLRADRVNTGVSDLFFNFADAGPAFNEENDTAALAVAEDFRTMLRAAGIAPPSAAALVADFRKRV